MLVKSSGLSPATGFRLRNVASALESRHSAAAFSAASNSKRWGESAGAGSNDTLVRSAGGTPPDPTIDAKSCRSSSVPTDASIIHSTMP